MIGVGVEWVCLVWCIDWCDCVFVVVGGGWIVCVVFGY